MTISGTRRAVVAGAAASVAVGARQGRAATVSRPNVLFILADDLGYADLSCYGQPSFTTPVLDQVAAQGVRLTQAYASSAVCSATRTALLTGRYQYRLPIGLWEPVTAPGELAVPREQATLASLFHGLGYRTSLVGKWHLGRYPDHNPRWNGYDYCFGFVGGASDYFNHTLWENETRVERPGYLTDILTERAIHEIETAAAMRRPFFMSLHFNAPHWPWEGPGDEAHARALAAEAAEAARTGAQDFSQRDYAGGSLQKYAEMVRYMDASIGKVLAALRARGLERDTIVVFTSDNGGERYSDVWPFVGMKGELLEGGLRVPAIVRWPARIRPGTRSDQVTASMDWLPTLLHAAGGAPDPAYPPDGENVWGAITGAEPSRPRKLYWRYKAAEQAAVRDGDWKYLKLGGKEHLFDLAADQHERADLKERRPEVFRRLAADFAAWNATMLAYPGDTYSENPKALGATADRY